jgi:hypothetical protein
MSLVKGGILSQFLLNYDFTKGFPAALTHTRASAATLVDESGNVVWADENVAVNSDLQSNWLSSRGDVTYHNDSTVGDFLTLTRHTLGSLYVNRSLSFQAGATYAVRVLVKAGTTNIAQIGDFTGGGFTKKLNSDTQTFTGTSGGTWNNLTATDYGNEWTEFKGFFSPVSAASTFGLMVGTNVSGDTLSFAQLSISRSDSDYVMTGASVYHAPRTTHDSDGNALGYLHEPQVTNLQSVSIPDTANWGETQLVIGENASVSPSGATDASDIIASAWSTAAHFTTRFYVAPSADTVMAMSLYAKAGAVNFLRLSIDSSSRAKSVFNLTDGSIVSTGGRHVSSYAEDVGNGWWRCVLVGTTSGASGNFIVYAHDDLNGTTAWAGDGSATSISVWGAQVEEGTAATSLIPTYGAEATRQADAVADYVVTGLSAVDSFTLLMKYSPLSDARQSIFGVTDGGSNSINWDSQRNASLHYIVDRGDAIGGTSDYDVSRSADVANMRVAFSYSSSLREADINGGGAPETSTKSMSTSTARGIDMLQFGSTSTNTIVKSVRLFGKSKTAAELATLTT